MQETMTPKELSERIVEVDNQITKLRCSMQRANFVVCFVTLAVWIFILILALVN